MNASPRIPIPLSAAEVLEMSFLENRARLLEIAAFLDRLDRAAGAESVQLDFRYRSLVHGIRLLLDPQGETRTGAIQESLSDHSEGPIPSAAGLKAHGAWQGVQL